MNLGKILNVDEAIVNYIYPIRNEMIRNYICPIWNEMTRNYICPIWKSGGDWELYSAQFGILEVIENYIWLSLEFWRQLWTIFGSV